LSISAGDPTSALTWFDKAVTLWPQSYLALAGRGRALAGLGRDDEAISAYQAAIGVAPQPDALTALGDLYALRGNEHDADEQYGTVELIAKLAALNQQVYNRQLALLANGRPADADAAEKNALALGTHDALLYYHAGVIAQAVGDTGRARTMLESALALPGALDPLAASKAQAALELLR